jgi:hypothetical protein
LSASKFRLLIPVLLSLLIAPVTGSAADAGSKTRAAPKPKFIDCIPQADGGDPATLTVSDKELHLELPGGKKETHRVVGRKVEGVGVRSRTIYLLKNGDFSFHDEYGCIRQPELVLKGRAEPITGIRCSVRDALLDCF